MTKEEKMLNWHAEQEKKKAKLIFEVKKLVDKHNDELGETDILEVLSRVVASKLSKMNGPHY